MISETEAQTQNQPPTSNEALCKLFVGNVSKNTSDEDFTNYFIKFGQMHEIVLMRDTNNPSQNRGFGFVTPKQVEVTDKILLEPTHQLDDRERALPKDIDDPLIHTKTTRAFVGGIPHNITEDELTKFFNDRYGQLGKVKEVIIKKERQTGRPRGFCFVSFENSHVVDKIMIEMRYPIINNKRCEVKKADSAVPMAGAPPSQLPRYESPTNRSGRGGYTRAPPANKPPAPSPQAYEYNGYGATNMMNYPQSNAYYSYYQNQAGFTSPYQQSVSATSGYAPPYPYPDQRNFPRGYPRTTGYSPNSGRTRPY